MLRLTRGDFDKDGGYLDVRRHWTPAGAYAPTKTEARERMIELPDGAYERLLDEIGSGPTITADRGRARPELTKTAPVQQLDLIVTRRCAVKVTLTATRRDVPAGHIVADRGLYDQAHAPNL